MKDLQDLRKEFEALPPINKTVLIIAILIGFLSMAGAIMAQSMSDILYYEGIRHYSMGDYAAAGDYLAQISNIQPYNHEIRYYLTYCYIMTGHLQTAREHASYLVYANPGQKVYEALLSQIDSAISAASAYPIGPEAIYTTTAGGYNLEIPKTRETVSIAAEYELKVIPVGEVLAPATSETHYPKITSDQTLHAPYISRNFYKISPPRPLSTLEEGIKAMDDGHTDRAIEKFVKVFNESRGKDYEPQYYMGVTYYMDGDYQKAANHFNNSAKLNPNHFQSLLYLAMIFNKQGNTGAAENYFKKALAIQKDEMIMINLIDLYLETGKVNEAIALYKEMDRLFPDSIIAATGLAYIDYINGNFNDAIYRVNRILSSSPTNPEANYIKSEIFLYNGLYTEAHMLADKARKALPNNPRYVLQVAKAMKHQENYEGAVALMLSIIEENPTYELARLELAELYASSGMSYDAETLIAGIKPAQTPRVYKTLALIDLANGKNDEAAENYYNYYSKERSPKAALEYADFLIGYLNKQKEAINILEGLIKDKKDTVFAETARRKINDHKAVAGI